MTFFGDSYDAWRIITYDIKKIENFNVEDRQSFLIALFNSPENAKSFLKHNVYKDEDEKNLAIKICMRDPKCIAELFLSNSNIFSKEQKKLGLELIWSHWAAIRILFNDNYFNQEQRMQAIKILIPSVSNICSLLTENIDKLTDEELEFILKYHHIHNDILKNIIKYHKNPIPRKKAFDYCIKDKINIYDLAKSKKLNDNEMQIVHDIYWGEYFEEKKRTYQDFLDHCEIFIYNLNEIELEHLTKKLIGNKKKEDIQRFSKLLPQSYKFKLEGYLIADKLKRGV